MTTCVTHLPAKLGMVSSSGPEEGACGVGSILNLEELCTEAWHFSRPMYFVKMRLLIENNPFLENLVLFSLLFKYLIIISIVF